MTIFFIVLLTSALVISVLVGTSIIWTRLNRYNQKLFTRAWEHEKFLMDIYSDCTVAVKQKIETYLNSIQPL